MPLIAPSHFIAHMLLIAPLHFIANLPFIAPSHSVAARDFSFGGGHTRFGGGHTEIFPKFVWENKGFFGQNLICMAKKMPKIPFGGGHGPCAPPPTRRH